MRDGFLIHERFLLHIEWRPRHSFKVPRFYLRLTPRGGDVTEEGVLVRCYECGGEGVLIDPATERALPVDALPQITPAFPELSLLSRMRANTMSMLFFMEERPLRNALMLGYISVNEYDHRRLDRNYTGLPVKCYEWNPLP